VSRRNNNGSRQRSAFPLELAKLLASRSYGHGMLAKLMTRDGHPITKQFLFQIAHGIRPCPVEQIRFIAESLKCTANERLKLNRAAAADQGYEL
jgi:hypothetical protein